jgi:hypothetical protein
VLQNREARLKSERILQKQFKPAEQTREMAETYYWGLQEKAVNRGSTDVNAFWQDFVDWDESKDESFLSQVKITLFSSYFGET